MNKLGYFILGATVSLVLSISSVAVAANTDLIAKLASYKVKVNGEVKKASNQVVIDDKIYLPLRDTANLLGYNVDFLNKEVNLTTTTTNSTGTSTGGTSTSVSNGNTTVSTYVKDLETKFSTDGKLDADKMKLALAAGEITVNSQDEATGDTLLQIVIKEDNFAAYSVLKGKGGIDLSLTNNEGQTALHTAVIEENSFYYSELESYFGIKSQYKDNNDKYPIDYAEKNSSFYISLLFIEKA